jgi:membrane peptidoglycan carboxypeptidase
VGASVVLIYSILAFRYDMGQIARPTARVRVYDREGQLLMAPEAGERTRVTRSDLPPFLIDALRAREDARFFDHGGVDLRGLGRALVRNVRDRRFTQGASTLSMQLVRNSFGLKQKSLDRKLLEIALTLRLEANYTKDEILTHYLNTIYFGSGADGIEQAAQTYFGKTTRELSDGESALLVGIIRGPHVFSPLRNLPGALAQREQTLDRLVAMNILDRTRRDQLAADPVTLAPESRRAATSSHALRAVRRELDWMLAEWGLPSAGLQVRTTLDAAWQQRLEQELARAATRLESDPAWPHPRHAAHALGSTPSYLQFAAVTTEFRTGDVLALVGGRDFGHSTFDRTRSRRDLGPVFEPFVAAAAAEGEHPVHPGQPMLTGRGPGVAGVSRVARRFGLHGHLAETEDLFRGAAAASPWEMAVGLATLANQGRRPTASLIREIRDASGQLVYQAAPRLVPAVRPASAAAALLTLTPSGRTRSLIGATGSERDAWMLRLGPNGATAVWMGFDTPAAIASESRVRQWLAEVADRLDNKP